MKMRELIEWLKEYDEETEVAYTLWVAEDITDYAKGMNISLTDEEVELVINKLNKYDAEVGINWHVIEEKIEEVKNATV